MDVLPVAGQRCEITVSQQQYPLFFSGRPVGNLALPGVSMKKYSGEKLKVVVSNRVFFVVRNKFVV